ncbi:MAG: FAD:protein FMN transferase [Candidatus Metalachnospira sp.]|nr:FAD:protein FMN transferase [Candidatus Metalachnospira sp.]
MKKLFFMLISVFLLTSCSNATSEAEPVSQTDFLLNTVCTITIYNEKNTEKDSNELITGAFDLCREYENTLSRTIEGSDVYKINHSNGKPVTVSDSTIEVINCAEKYSKDSNGAFDISIAPLSILWNFEGDNPTVPPDAEISALVQEVDYTKVKVNGNDVTLEAPVTAIDLGGIAKGYIADRVSEYLETNNVTSAIINLGGNIYTVGTKPDGNNFNIGIQDPSKTDGSILGYVAVSNKSVVTSGSYERYFIQDGKKYHHILDPSTGYPVENGLCSVSIISDNSIDGDSLSTTCFVLGKDEGMKLINSLDGVQAIFIDDNGEMYFSDGIGKDVIYTEYTE